VRSEKSSGRQNHPSDKKEKSQSLDNYVGKENIKSNKLGFSRVVRSHGIKAYEESDKTQSRGEQLEPMITDRSRTGKE